MDEAMSLMGYAERMMRSHNDHATQYRDWAAMYRDLGMGDSGVWGKTFDGYAKRDQEDAKCFYSVQRFGREVLHLGS